MGYNISLAVSVNRLTSDKVQTVRVMYFKFENAFVTGNLLVGPDNIACVDRTIHHFLFFCTHYE
jgi:hypothetical protein